ncbi:hypothetical protein NL676_008579 [Syzygium grande]|nr:hypothetical protein NL676_008579 [Syzygium grande]
MVASGGVLVVEATVDERRRWTASNEARARQNSQRWETLGQLGWCRLAKEELRWRWFSGKVERLLVVAGPARRDWSSELK